MRLMYNAETTRLIYRISTILTDHRGPGNAIARRELRRALRITFGDDETSDREMRAMIKKHLPGVCYGSRGYYLPRDKGEADKTLDQNRKRALSLFEASSNLRKAYPDWYGNEAQMELFN